MHTTITIPLKSKSWYDVIFKLSSLVAPVVVTMTTSIITIDDKMGIIIATLRIQCLYWVPVWSYKYIIRLLIGIYIMSYLKICPTLSQIFSVIGDSICQEHFIHNLYFLCAKKSSPFSFLINIRWAYLLLSSGRHPLVITKSYNKF